MVEGSGLFYCGSKPVEASTRHLVTRRIFLDKKGYPLELRIVGTTEKLVVRWLDPHEVMPLSLVSNRLNILGVCGAQKKDYDITCFGTGKYAGWETRVSSIPQTRWKLRSRAADRDTSAKFHNLEQIEICFARSERAVEIGEYYRRFGLGFDRLLVDWYKRDGQGLMVYVYLTDQNTYTVIIKSYTHTDQNHNSSTTYTLPNGRVIHTDEKPIIRVYNRRTGRLLRTSD